MKVRKAVFPAAGLGTRFLPATKAQPKEMLPLVDKPIIQYVGATSGTPRPRFPAPPPLSCAIGTPAAHSSSSTWLPLQRMR
jgi:hypothetical protein